MRNLRIHTISFVGIWLARARDRRDAASLLGNISFVGIWLARARDRRDAASLLGDSSERAAVAASCMGGGIVGRAGQAAQARQGSGRAMPTHGLSLSARA
jgi:hypothetical protein